MTASMHRGPPGGRPIILASAGRANLTSATRALAGLPGSPMCGTAAPSGRASAPNASGRDGRIRTDQKSISPISESASFTRSNAPALTPADVISRSVWSPSSSLARSACGSSGAMPRKSGSAPQRRTAEATP